MSLPFSFSAQRNSGISFPELVVQQPGMLSTEVPNALHGIHQKEMQEVNDITTTLPMTGGLAALAVQQSTSGPLAAPSRRLTSYLAPGPAIAASLALAAQNPETVQQPPIESSPPTAPAANHFNTLQSLQSRDLAQLRMELESEIEQVRQDLFGAAMGVSALKDRIDGLETTLERTPARTPEFPSAEMEHQLRKWLDTYLPSYVEDAVQQRLEQAMEETISTLSSSEFFRMPVHTPGLTPDILLSQAPQILSSTLS